jgi:hypothetical protein
MISFHNQDKNVLFGDFAKNKKKKTNKESALRKQDALERHPFPLPDNPTRAAF